MEWASVFGMAEEAAHVVKRKNKTEWTFVRDGTGDGEAL